MNWLIRKAFEACYPRVDGLPGIADCDLDAYVRQLRREMSPLFSIGFYLGVVLFHLSPILTVFVPLPAFLLPRKLLDRHAYKAATTRLYTLRQCTFMVKMAAGLHWGAHPKVREALDQRLLPADPGTFHEGEVTA